MKTRHSEVTLRSVLIARGAGGVRVYGSVETVPEDDRGRVREVLESHRVLTVLIADKQGRETLDADRLNAAQPAASPAEPDGGVMQALALCGVGALVVWAIATLL